MLASLSLRCGGYAAGLLRLFAPPFLPALPCWAAGSVIHAVHTTLLSEMGWLRPTHLFASWVHFGSAIREPPDYGFAAISLVGAVAGIAVGYRLYSRWRERDPLTRLGPAYAFIQHKYYLDDIYMGGLVRPI